jgi:hypothetical protein
MFTLAAGLKAAHYWRKHDDNKEDCLHEAIKALDQALFMGGAPVLKQDIHALMRVLLWHAAESRQRDCARIQEQDRMLKLLQNETALPEWIQLPGEIRLNSSDRDNLYDQPRQIPVRDASTITMDDLQTLHEPLLIRGGALEEWPAVNSQRPWSNLSNLFSTNRLSWDRWIPVELGSSYTDTDWSQKAVPVHEFAQMMLDQTDINQTVYLAQHDLFHQIPALWEDIQIPEYCDLMRDVTQEESAESSRPIRANLWLGPKGTRSMRC